MDTKEFVKDIIVDRIGEMIDAEMYHMAFILMGQSIETLGAVIDSKPLKAKAQSRKRFDSAIYRLFPKDYQQINKNGFLYDQLRTTLTHLFVPGGFVLLTSASNKEYGNKHLQKENNRIILVAEEFYNDLVKAANRLFDGIDKGIVKRKEIKLDYFEQFFY
ncbi:MAG: hypothetical protein N4A72_03510 [Bacteroidales bacterium]|jgi:hypothetical protein|nr:hypothetical protein [Bacteroidales bacterium]